MGCRFALGLLSILLLGATEGRAQVVLTGRVLHPRYSGTDETIPLTANEWEEWGDPRDQAYFEYMSSYSPYDNVHDSGDYPVMLVTAGLNDPRVGYWEPAKWTARMRAVRTDTSLLLLRTNMGAGHFGASGRYGQLGELAFQYAFILDQLGITQ